MQGAATSPTHTETRTMPTKADFKDFALLIAAVLAAMALANRVDFVAKIVKA